MQCSRPLVVLLLCLLSLGGCQLAWVQKLFLLRRCCLQELRKLIRYLKEVILKGSEITCTRRLISLLNACSLSAFSQHCDNYPYILPGQRAYKAVTAPTVYYAALFINIYSRFSSSFIIRPIVVKSSLFSAIPSFPSLKNNIVKSQGTGSLCLVPFQPFQPIV